jgi:hypothetical protein
MAKLVRRLPPEALYRVIQRRGLEDCSDVIALATPEQLARVFDLDLWRSATPGRDEQFDADRFGTWLEVMLDAGAGVAARKLAGMDVAFVAAAFAHHVRVFDYAAVAPYETFDGELVSIERASGEGPRCELGGYVIVARRTSSWDAITVVLTALDDGHQAFFNELMGGCRRLSNSAPEIDGLDDLLGAGGQVMFDLAVAREHRRDAQGYVPPAQARAFLEAARRAGTRRASPAVRGVETTTLAIPHTTGDDEVARLANTLMAGCSILSRPFTPQEAWDGTVAVCTLGSGSFEAGWAVLYNDVCMRASECLIDVLSSLRSHDAETEAGIERLRVTLTREWRAGQPWMAGDALDVLAVLDVTASVALAGLIAEFPVLHAALRASVDRAATAVSATAFEFIAGHDHVATVHRFLDVLPALLER